MSTLSQRKQRVLSLREKVDVFDALENNTPGIELAERNVVRPNVISTFKKSTGSIRDFFATLNARNGSVETMIMKNPQNGLLDEAVFRWFILKRSLALPLSGDIVSRAQIQGETWR